MDSVDTGFTSQGSTHTQLTNEISILIVNHAEYNIFIGIDGVGTRLTS